MIYLLEDDASIQNFVLYALQNTGFEAEGFERPSDFWKRLDEKIPDLLLLDIMLPEEDGIEILKKLRADKRTRKMPIIMLTARSTEYDKVIGLDSGADDYVAKPFSMMELVSRIKALIRRSEMTIEKEDSFHIGPLYVSLSKHVVKVNGEEKDIAGKTLAEYFETTKYDMKRVATEINGEIVPKAQYAQTVLKDGDNVEVVSFVGGG